MGPVTTGLPERSAKSLDLGPTSTINANAGMTNNGLVTGDGQIGGTFTNAAAGELRGEPGKSLKLTGANNTNAGQINLFGGLVEFTQNLTNNAGGFISGNGTIKTNALTNNGTMNFSGLANVVGDVTNPRGSKIISSGGGPTTFLDDVVNNGEIRTSAGSFTTFYGSTSGSGTYTGLGTVNFEGDLKPGNSPAAVSFGGDVVLGVASTLQMEIGGITPGSQFDQLNVTGKLILGGTLQVVLANGFMPSIGQSFDLLNWGTVAGSFTAVMLPGLASGAWDMSQLSAGIVSVISGDSRRLQQQRHRGRGRLHDLARSPESVDHATQRFDPRCHPERLRHLAHPFRPNRRQRIRRSYEFRHPRTDDIHAAFPSGNRLPFPSPPIECGPIIDVIRKSWVDDPSSGRNDHPVSDRASR